MPKPPATRVALGVHHRLTDYGWETYVGSALGLCVWIDQQRLQVIDDHKVLASYVCSTAKLGPGEREGSYCTPRGWHEVAERIGGDIPINAILERRVWNGQTWKGDEESVDD